MTKKPIYLTGDDAIEVATFRNNLKYILVNKNMSFSALARKMKMTPGELKTRVYGSTKPNEELMQKIADALGCTIDDLLDEDGNPWNFGKSAEEIAELNAIKKREHEMRKEEY